LKSCLIKIKKIYMENNCNTCEKLLTLKDNLTYLDQLYSESLSIYTKLVGINNSLELVCEKGEILDKEGEEIIALKFTPTSLLEKTNYSLEKLHFIVFDIRNILLQLFEKFHSKNSTDVVNDFFITNLITVDFGSCSLYNNVEKIIKISYNFLLLQKTFNVLDNIIFNYNFGSVLSEEELKTILNRDDIGETKSSEEEKSPIDVFHNSLISIDSKIDNIRTKVEKICSLLDIKN